MNGILFDHRLNLCGFNLPLHFENLYQILIVLRGHIVYTVEENSYDMAERSIVVLNTMENHFLKVLEYPYERVIIRLDPSYFFDEVKAPELMGLFIQRSKGFRHKLDVSDEAWEVIHECISSIEKEYNSQKSLSELIVGAEIRKLFVHIHRGMKIEDNLPSSIVSTVGRAMNYMNMHFKEKLRVEEIANIAMVSKDHLSHIFSKTTGKSIKQYLIDLRINHAKFLLSETEKSISEIAEDCGYEDMNFFSRQFRNEEEISPSEFRKIIRNQLQ
ncbi:MAG: AraC family transcriptional regulator [Candidatus Ornithospirochaeta sp.]|nr:AraC family transcriptional regulator [Candidatus Ornithospirochaeta sp.]